MTDDLSPNARRELEFLAKVTGPEQTEAIIISHQRFENGRCLCGYHHIGKSHAAHVAAELRKAGVLKEGK